MKRFFALVSSSLLLVCNQSFGFYNPFKEIEKAIENIEQRVANMIGDAAKNKSFSVQDKKINDAIVIDKKTFNKNEAIAYLKNKADRLKALKADLAQANDQLTKVKSSPQTQVIVDGNVMKKTDAIARIEKKIEKISADFKAINQ